MAIKMIKAGGLFVAVYSEMLKEWGLATKLRSKLH